MELLASNSGKGIQVTSSATLGDYDLSAVSYLSIAANKTLAGQLNLQTNGELKTSGDGQYIGDIALAGGKFSATDNQVLGGTLSITADSELTVSQGYTLTLSQSGGLALGANTLTLSGGGTLSNTINNALVLNHADSHLVLDNVTVGFVTASAASNSSKGLKVSLDSTLTNLSMTEKLRLSVDSGKTLTLAGPLTVPTQGMDLAGAGTLDLSDNLTLNGNVTLASGGSLTIDARGLQLNLGGDLNLVGGVLLTDNSTNFHLLANSTLTTNAEQTVANVTIPANEAPMLTLGNTTKLEVVKIVSIANSCPQSLPIQPKAQVKLVGGSQINAGGTMCIDGWLEGDIVLNGGTLQIDADTTISSDSSILLSSSSILKIVGGYSLTYGGDALSVDNKTLSLSGGGSLVLNSDGSNPVTLNNADGELEFSGDNITTVSHVKTSSGATTNMPTLKMTGSGVIQNLAHEEFLEINFASGKTLSITEAFEVPVGKQMTILGAAGTLSIGDNMSLTGTLNLAVEDAILSSGSLTLNGGLLEVSDNASISSAVIQKVSSEFSVATGKTLSYTGSSFDISAYTLTLSGGGNFQSGGLDLNNANSKLLLNSITVDNVSTTVDNSLGVDVDNDSTITSLSVANITPVSIASGKTLSGAITVTAGSLKLNETGTLASTIAMSGGILDADESLTVSGALTQSGDIAIDVATSKTLTYSGAAISLGANTITLSGGGSFVSGGLTLNNADSKLLLNSITVDSVSTTIDNSLGVDVDNNSTITSLSVANITPVSIASGKSLSGAITVTAGSLKLNETGTLTSSVSMSGGTLDADNSLTVSGALTQSGSYNDRCC